MVGVGVLEGVTGVKLGVGENVFVGDGLEVGV